MIENKSLYDQIVDMCEHINTADMSETCKCVLFDEQIYKQIKVNGKVKTFADFQDTLPRDMRINCNRLQHFYERAYNFKSNHDYDPYKSLKGIHY